MAAKHESNDFYEQERYEGQAPLFRHGGGGNPQYLGRFDASDLWWNLRDSALDIRTGHYDKNNPQYRVSRVPTSLTHMIYAVGHHRASGLGLIPTIEDDNVILHPGPDGKVLFHAIPTLTSWGNYAVDHDWRYLEQALADYKETYNFDFGESDFQRAHVWTEAQQIKYVEYILRGGAHGKDILTNCVDWNGRSEPHTMVLVDGKQRLTAALRFLRNDLAIFGGYKHSQFNGHMRHYASFKWYVNDLPDRASVLRWFVDLNRGGTVHTDAEIQHVRDLLALEVA